MQELPIRNDMADRNNVEELPSLSDFLSSCQVIEKAPEGEFPEKDSKSNQLALSVDFKKFKPRELLYIKARLEGKNQTQSAIAAGFSEHSAAVMGSRKEKQLQEDLDELMNQKGLTLSNLLDKLKQLIDAETLKYHPGTQEMLAVCDNSIQSRNLETALKLKGALRTDEQQMPTTINVIVGADINGNPIDRSKSIAMPVNAEVVDPAEAGEDENG